MCRCLLVGYGSRCGAKESSLAQKASVDQLGVQKVSVIVFKRASVWVWV